MATDTGKKISVCLLTYNHVDVIEATLQSILDQTITGYEVIISDDCSTDGTWEKVQEFAEKDRRIRAVKTPCNMGMPGNANFAVAQSIRPYIALLHHDDLYRNDLLEKWCAAIEQSPDIAFVFNSYGVYKSDYIYAESIPAGRINGPWFLEKYLFPRWGCAVRGTAMIRREAWEQLGGMREQFGLLADIDLWMRLSMQWAVGYVSEPVITVRHQRPEYYPDIYKNEGWSWQRKRYIYEIQASNHLAYYDLDTMMGRLNWWAFRVKLSLETTKWLIYAVVRRNVNMIRTSEDSVTPYDLPPLRLIRGMLRLTLIHWEKEKIK